jgi:hypothetical protein
MAVAIAGTPSQIATGDSYTAEPGSDRVVVWVFADEDFFSVTASPTMGSQAFTEGVFIEGTDRSYAGIYYIKEADIPAGSQTMAAVWSASVDGTTLGTVLTLTGVEQTTVGTGFSMDTVGTPTETLDITGVADGVAVAIFTHEQENAGIIADSAWTTQRNEEDLGAYRIYTATKTTTSGADTFEPVTTIARQGVLASFVFDAAVTTITTIAPDPAASAVPLTITGTNFEATQNTGAVTQEQGAIVVGLTETAWADLEITATSALIESTQLKYGTQTLRVTNDAGGSDAKTFVENPEVGSGFVDLTSIESVAANRITAVADLAIGDQIRYTNTLSGGGGFSVTVNPDATVTIDGATPEGMYTFDIIVWDNADQTWSTVVEQDVVIGPPCVIRTVGATGKDHTTIAAAVSWFVANHDFDVNGIAVISIEDSAEYLNETINITGIAGTATATAYLKLTVAPANRHAGVAGTGHARIRRTSSFTAGITAGEDFTVIEYLEIKHDNIAGFEQGIALATNTTNVTSSRNIIWTDGGVPGNNSDGVYCPAGSNVVNVDNCIIYGWPRGGINLANSLGTDVKVANVESCTLYDNDMGIRSRQETTASNTINLYNTAALDNTTSGFTDSHDTSTWTGSNNASTDTSLTTIGVTVNAQESLTSADTTQSSGSFFVVNNLTAGSEDLLLLDDAAGNLAVGNGIDRVGSEPDARQDFSLDIVGNLRSTTVPGPDIGASEFAAIITNITGTISQTEDNDTLVANGNTGGISGTATVTELNDTANSSGELSFTGSISQTEDDDTANSSGELSFTGSISQTEDDDTANSSGELSFTGSISQTELNDTANSSGELSFDGTTNTTEDDDTANSSGELSFDGTTNTTEDDDTANSSGELSFTGSISQTEDDDTANSSGELSFTGSTNTTEEDDTLVATGDAGGLAGTIILTELNDTANSSGEISFTGSTNITEDDDTANSSGEISFTGSTNITEDGDTLAATGDAGGLAGTIILTELNDTSNSSGEISFTGSTNTTEDDDTLVAVGNASGLAGTIILTELNDTSNSSGEISFTGSTNITEDDDTLVAVGNASGLAGTIILTEDDDLISSSGDLSFVGSSNVQSDNDIVVGSATLLFVGGISTTDDNDSTITQGSLIFSGDSISTEDNDTIISTGVLQFVGSVNQIEDHDTVVSSGIIPVDVSGTINKIDENDLSFISGTIPSPGKLDVQEQPDQVFATGVIIDFPENPPGSLVGGAASGVQVSPGVLVTVNR